MEGKGSLVLDLIDVYGDHVNDRFDLLLQHTVLMSAAVNLKNRDASGTLQVDDLDSTQGGLYKLLAYPSSYRPVGQFVTIREEETTQLTLTMPIVPEKVVSVDFPAYAALPADLQNVLTSSDVEGSEGVHAADLYNSFDNIQRAGLLNIFWKMRHTTFANERNVFSYISSLTRVRGDRFFSRVQTDLRDTVKNSEPAGLFHEVDGSLHTPPPGYQLADSFKTPDRYGNLQLTFFSKIDSLEFIVDADIDDAQGIEHIFQVLHNSITGDPTHPYNIHEILVFYQKIDPRFRLFV